MDVERSAQAAVKAAIDVLDAGWGDFLNELLDVGEFDIALVSAIEAAPAAMDATLMDEVDAHYRGSGDYVEEQAVNAVEAFRRRVVA